LSLKIQEEKTVIKMIQWFGSVRQTGLRGVVPEVACFSSFQDLIDLFLLEVIGDALHGGTIMQDVYFV